MAEKPGAEQGEGCRTGVPMPPGVPTALLPPGLVWGQRGLSSHRGVPAHPHSPRLERLQFRSSNPQSCFKSGLQNSLRINTKTNTFSTKPVSATPISRRSTVRQHHPQHELHPVWAPFSSLPQFSVCRSNWSLSRSFKPPLHTPQVEGDVQTTGNQELVVLSA